MTRDLEARVRSAMRLCTEDVRPASTIADDLVRHGRARHRRRVAVGSAAAAAGVIAVTMLAVNLVQPPGTDEPVVPSTTTPTAPTTPSGEPTTTPSAEPVPTAPQRFPSSEAGVAVLYRDGNSLRAADGRTMGIPHGPDGTPAMRMTAVRGGWVVDYENLEHQTGDLAFLGDDGTVRAFTPAVPDAWYAVSPDRTQVAARGFPEEKVYIFDLPSLTVVRTLDAPQAGVGQPTDVWFTGDRVAIQYIAMGDPLGDEVNATAFVVWNVRTGARTVSPEIEVRDVADDGSVAVLNLIRWGSDGEVRRCFWVVEFADRLAEPEEQVCDPRSNDIDPIIRHALSPDREWLAVAVVPDDTVGPPTPTDIVFYRVDDLRSGATPTPVSFVDQYPTDGHVYLAGWYDGQAVLYASGFAWVVRCDPRTGACSQVGVPTRPAGVAL